MEQMKREQVKNAIKEWLIEIDKSEKLPKDIIALNFGLFEPYGVELIGSESYDAEDDDWACEEDFVPKQRICPNIEISDTVHWATVLQDISGILKEIIIEGADITILQTEHITAGFCDGDLVIIK